MGSQKWIQFLINENVEVINKQIRANLRLPETEEVEWLSPLKSDDYSEYRDKSVLDLLEITNDAFTVRDFWPDMGPQWDAIGRAANNVLLVEAKSHITEFISTCQAKQPESIAKINTSLQETKVKLGCKTDFDWSKTFYQYANRLAHINP